MNLIQRRKLILDELKINESVEVKILAKMTKSSEVTIRNDLRELEQQGKLVRFFGGAHRKAQLITETFNHELSKDELAVSNRYAINSDAKLRIAKYAATLVPLNATLILDSGSTTHLIAEELAKRGNITVITNNLLAAVSLSNAINTTLILCGGLYRAKSHSLHGKIAEEALRDIRADLMFIGADSFDPVLGMTTFNEGFNISRVMSEKANQIIAVVDSSKFKRAGYNQILSTEQIDILITDTGITSELTNEFTNKGINVKSV
ncbi:DeoR/GlpR family DNA-binding transcription regulator [Thorsellia anophelis]|uniref:Transcriptional regulator, DeoR family n=1 Tax=Thorsellia anophelis DSM 18579 TaxID=1123402 RepID=A0A1I0EYT5_9GAMM|nr:DeoR/GlpR family DNA-binding transcription regulator [Thorsellia anophelis]SET50866.1 transcriptional regulator, DeoR family [Thorsellia anophelis DSM 18579]